MFVSIENLFKLLNQSKQSFVSIENLFKLKLTQSNQLFDCLIVSYITGITSYCTWKKPWQLSRFSDYWLQQYFTGDESYKSWSSFLYSICLSNGKSDWTHPVNLSLPFVFFQSSDRGISLTQAIPNFIFTPPLLLWVHCALNTVNKSPPQILRKRILAVQGMKFHLSCNINNTQVIISYHYFKTML